MAREQYQPLTMEEAEDFIGRTAWRSAQSTEDVAPHQYVVQKRGQRRDDFTEEDFWRMVELIKTEGHRELWTPPKGVGPALGRQADEKPVPLHR